jgi:hypothetical protein
MVMSLAPISIGGSFSPPHEGRPINAASTGTQQGHCIVGNNDSKSMPLRHFSAAEFARLSPSMKVTLLIIRRAQLSSRKAIAATAEWKRRCGDG